ncbi:hypothetical protein ISF_00165 [Cordyceps fumosorosea ARSEF 2679]|uniref:Uncharacterized protein n=1 Tax=Cordyceps fumosorosea (strain ARSEF 2679) TaxID=1081104 RepID=A0A162LNF8_CORFA|nr:hypothetical protein ISF_00165 [Cordyceps fumosorosea ARSEF 2679]OAA73264.1 hypothetical protein ISF_00165 [Cordyceps fumosorosea ARSEF 2679]
MAATQNQPPSPDLSPTLALGSCPELSRCVSTASSLSHGSVTEDSSRESLGSGLNTSRHSSGSYHSRRSDASHVSRRSTHSADSKTRRRGYMRPQATDFAASARSRESVMSLGSIAHLQYYFARTGLLDGKGAQLARKKQPKITLDLSALDGSADTTGISASDFDSSYASMGSSPDLASHGGFAAATITQSPVKEEEDYYDEDSFTESESGMLPPTVSTYHHRETPIPRPPTIMELKAELEATLRDAQKALKEAEARKAGAYLATCDEPALPNMPEENSQGWYELQGMHILDVVTLAIRAAKMYYTAHEQPDRLDSIKSEKQVRSDLLAVMEVLKQMAIRGFKGGMKDDDTKTMLAWTDSVFDILHKEEAMEAAEAAERSSWTWMRADDWSGRKLARESAFLTSMDPEAAAALPVWTPAVDASTLPTPFLAAMQNGLRLVRLHNAAVHKSKRRFGAIPSFHTDTQKPYRCADNLRYWVKAAELRFEVVLAVDALGVAYGTDRQAWLGFEAAILKWCQHVREEITNELRK